MHAIDPVTVSPSDSLRKVMVVIDQTRIQIALVTDASNRLVGTCTDGDIRRALLKGHELSAPVEVAMNRNPITARDGESRAEIIARMRRAKVLQVPIVDAGGVLKSVALLSDPRRHPLDEAPVVLMAGGVGSRLRPLTDNCPKPMLPIAGKPLLERILNTLRDQGFSTVYLSVNYLGHVIESYFGTGDSFGLEIAYLREDRPLGTAGALRLLPSDISSPVIVMNADILTDLDFRALLEHHTFSGNAATMCVREHRTTIPFGVVEHEDGRYIRTTEKPTLSHQINAGVYCLEAEVLNHVPAVASYDMPTLFEDLTAAGRRGGVYPIHDAWLDIGSPADYERAQMLFKP
jgi:dTDP-glucose pyrophosphorylase